MNQSRQMIHDLNEFQGVVQAETGSSDGHTHMVTIPANVDGGAGDGHGLRIITGPGPKNGHTHEVEITSEDLANFHDGQTVTVTTGPDNQNDPHTHSLTFDRTMEPPIDPRQDNYEGSVNVLGSLPFPRAGARQKKKRPKGGTYA